MNINLKNHFRRSANPFPGDNVLFVPAYSEELSENKVKHLL